MRAACGAASADPAEPRAPTRLRSAGPVPLPPGECRLAGVARPVVWASPVKVAVDGSTITKNAGCDGCSDAGAISQQPRVTRLLWHLQFTRHKLPTDKFKQAFGRHNKYTFVQAMETTCSWLRFAGFALPPTCGGKET